MNFQALKMGFMTYLMEQQKGSNNNYDLNNTAISIFMYEEEFKEYIAKELNLDPSICNENLTDLLNMEIRNGELVNPDELTEEGDINNGLQQTETNSQVETGYIMIQKSNGASHTGIVVGVDDKYIYTIEGNSGDAVRERKYEIGSSAYSKISGWIRMNEWSGGNNNVATDTYLANNNSEDADEKKCSTI